MASVDRKLSRSRPGSNSITRISQTPSSLEDNQPELNEAVEKNEDPWDETMKKSNLLVKSLKELTQKLKRTLDY